MLQHVALTGKTEIISLMRGFHGKSLGSLSATWDKNYQELFMPLVPGFTHVPANKLVKLEAALTDDMADVIMEVVKGEGGVPMGAILCRSSINLPQKSHTSIFGGNPLACTAALASIEFIIEEKLPERVLALLAGANVIRFLPPLVITNDEIDRVVTALKTMLDS